MHPETPDFMPLRVISHVNPYRDNVQGKANEPITVAALLDRSKQLLGSEWPGRPDWSLEAIYDRLEENSPRIAIIGGSPDHPAHIVDEWTRARAALSVWAMGGLPFAFSTPVLCDGTAQNNMGMSYSLQSRNAIASVVINQMEAHSYHGAFVIQGCDKQPTAVLCGLAHLDYIRQLRGESPVFAAFAPAHVLKGGTIPAQLRAELEQIASAAERAGHEHIAEDLRDTLAYILQCSSNTAFQGILARAVAAELITAAKHRELERSLAVNTCDGQGGICAFNGTGNSSRLLLAGLGMVHPAVELLTSPPSLPLVERVARDLMGLVNRPACSVRGLVRANIGNAVKAYSASGGSTNLMMHIVAVMLYAGFPFSIWDIDRIRKAHPIPDLFDYSLTQGRDIFTLAQQCCSGQNRGMETLIHELAGNGIPMDQDALTVTGTTWKERLSESVGLGADGVAEQKIILSSPRRAVSGVDILTGNFFTSAVVKISGMPDPQLNEFDGQVAAVLFFGDEEEANEALLDTRLLERLRGEAALGPELLQAMLRHNGRLLGQDTVRVAELPPDDLFEAIAEAGLLKIAIVIAGQGPEAFGMPEMFTPMQHINANRRLRKLAVLISDGRYSGVSYGAAIGHVTPEAYCGGGIGRLATGDLLHLRLRSGRIDLLDPAAFAHGQVHPDAGILETRDLVARARVAVMRRRRRTISAVNLLSACTDASMGVVPNTLADLLGETEEPQP